jgi:hypothetical protein
METVERADQAVVSEHAQKFERAKVKKVRKKK